MLSFSIFSDVGLLCYLLWTIFYTLLAFISSDFALFKASLYTCFTVRFMMFLYAVTDFE